MAYLVTAKRGGLELRDGSTASDPMHKLVEGVPVLFQHMPCGYRLPGDGQVGIVEAKTAPAPIPMDVTPTPMAEGLVLAVPVKRHKKSKGQ